MHNVNKSNKTKKLYVTIYSYTYHNIVRRLWLFFIIDKDSKFIYF